MNFSQKWFIETTDGRSFRLLIKEGYFPRLLDALSLYHDDWFLIMTSDLSGREEEIISSISLENKVDIKIDFQDKRIIAFYVTNKEGKEILSHKNIRLVEQRAP